MGLISTNFVADPQTMPAVHLVAVHYIHSTVVAVVGHHHIVAKVHLLVPGSNCWRHLEVAVVVVPDSSWHLIHHSGFGSSFLNDKKDIVDGTTMDQNVTTDRTPPNEVPLQSRC